MRRAVIVVTADPIYRLENRKAVSTETELQKIGFKTTLFDIEFTSPEELRDYDIVFFSGGNPFYLLDQVRKTETDVILREMLQDGKVISGSSAGSLVLGSTIIMINEFDPQMNERTDLENFDAVGLTDIIICPHYSKYKNRYENFEDRICLVERREDIKIDRIDDGEALIIQDGTVRRI